MKKSPVNKRDDAQDDFQEKLGYYLSLKFPCTVEESEEEGRKIYILSFPDLPGCWAEGETLEEAHQKLDDAKAAWMRASLNEGLPIPEPAKEDEFSGKFLLRIPPKLHMGLTKIAEKAGVSLNQLIRSTLEETVNNKLILAKLNSIETSLNELKIEMVGQRAQPEGETHLLSLRNKWDKPQSKWGIN